MNEAAKPKPAKPHAAALDELASRTATALRMGGEDKLAKRRAKGVLDARQRLDVLLDPGTFVESGMHARGMRPEVAERTPADGKLAGYGRIDGREVGVISNDFTVLGASSSAILPAKNHISSFSPTGRISQWSGFTGTPGRSDGESRGRRAT